MPRRCWPTPAASVPIFRGRHSASGSSDRWGACASAGGSIVAISEISDRKLRLAARRAYERGRLKGAVARGAGALILAIPGYLVCGHSSLAMACLIGLGLVVALGRLRGEEYEDGVRAGFLAGILPCLLPAMLRLFDRDLCDLLFARGPWLC